MLIRALCLSGFLAVSACSTVQSIPGVPGGEREDPASRLETILDARIVEGDILVIRVASNGCTQKADFDVTVRRRGGEHEVTIERTREDYCRALLPEGVEIPWGFEELGVRRGQQVRVVNPVAG